MYGHKTKHKILTTFIQWQVRHPNNSQATLEFETLHKMTKGSTVDQFSKSCIYLECEGYLKFEYTPLSKNVWVGITEKGISAWMESYFLSKHDEIFYRRLIDVGLVVFNGIIALVAIIALNRGNSNDLKHIEDRITLIEQQMIKPKMQTQTTTIPEKSGNKANSEILKDSTQ